MRASIASPSTHLRRAFGLLISAALALPCTVSAQAPGTAGYRTAAQQRQEFIAKLRRDIAKVAHSIKVTKELIARSRGAPFLPDIYLRLAELYIEQARYEFYLVHEERGENSKGSAVAPTAKLLKEKAVETYQRILADWPDYKDNDKVIFFLAHEYRELGRYEEMIKMYEKLVSKHPKSPLVLDAYLVLGDYRFDKQDLMGAKGYYQKILDAPESPTQDMAHFKMGWVFLNETDYKEALHHFEAAVRSGNDPDSANSRREKERLVNVKREALADLAYAYTEVRKPRGALRYFRTLSTSRTMYLLALRKLAKRYFIKQEFNAAAMVYREIARLSYDAELNLDFTNRIYVAAKNAKNYRLVHRDVRAMLRALDDYRYDWRVPVSQREAAEVDFENYTRDMSTKAQARFLKKKVKKKSKSRKKMGPRIALAYTRYLQSFPESEHRMDILENLADTLFEAKLYIRAGDRFEEAAMAAGEDEKRKEQALYNACASFHEALKNAAKLERFDRIWAQHGLVNNGIQYVETFPDSAKVPEIKLNIGRSYFESGDFKKAIGIFDEFIASYPSHKSGATVADLILDAYAQMDDYEALASRARELAQVSGLGDAAFKNRLEGMAKGAEERQIGEVILEGSGMRAAGGNAGEQLRKFWEENQDSPVAEKTLYTAFVQYKDSRDFDKTFETGNQFIGAYPKSQYLGDVFGTLASFTTQTGEYEQAAVYLEEFYKRFPTDSSAQKMLSQAGNIKQLIGDHRGAIQVFQELMGSVKDRGMRSTYATKMLNSYEALADWEGMKSAASSVIRVDQQNVKAHLMLGLAAQKSGDLDTAIGEFQSSVMAAGRAADDDSIKDAARAAFLIGDILFKQFERVESGGDMQMAAEMKAALLGEMEGALVDAVGYNQGEWAVAALHRAAMAYRGFSDFLEKAPPPEGLSPEENEQYKQLVAEQVSAIRAKSMEFFETCVARARELSVFTGVVLACVAQGPEENTPMVALNSSAPPQQRQEELKALLTKNPKDLDAIADMADYFLASGQPAKAKLMSARGLELDERDGRFHNKMGMADLLMGDPQSAHFGFQHAADLNHPYAKANLIAMALTFKDADRAKKIVGGADLDELPLGAPDLHPAAATSVDRAAQ